MITIGRVKIDRIPDYFLERYDSEIAAWAQNYQKIGMVKTFVLREGHFAKPSPAEDQGPELLAVKLVAKMSRRGVEIAPLTEQDERIIANHCAKMQILGVPSRARLKEPLRPGLPFMPTIGGRHAVDEEGNEGAVEHEEGVRRQKRH